MSIRSSLTHHEGTHRSTRPSRRSATIGLEQQSAIKFALALCIGLGALVAHLSTPVAALLLINAVVIAGRALSVLGADPADRTAYRPTDEADWDAALATILGVLALGLAIDGAELGALIAGLGAMALAFLRLRTRYVL